MPRFGLPSNHRNAIIALVLCIVAVTYIVAYLLIFSAYPADDAFIHMRIARTWAQDGQPFFNIDEPVYGTSSPLWTAAVALGFVLFGASPSVVVGLAIISTVACFGALFVLLRPSLHSIKAMIVAFGIMAVGVLNTAAMLMEVPMAMLVWFLAAQAFQRGAWRQLGFWSALAVGVRFEFALWCALVFIFVGSNRARWHFLQGTLMPGIALVAFGLGYFGTLLPNTIHAKSVAYAHSLAIFLQTFSGLPAISLVFITVLVFIVAVAWRLPSAPWVRTAALFSLCLMAVHALRGTYMSDWYIPLIVVPFYVAGAMVLRKRALYPLLLVTVIVPSILLSTLLDAYALTSGDLGRYRHFDLGRRVRQYLHIGEQLAQRRTDGPVMAIEIGALGWTYPGKIIDAVGLVSPEMIVFQERTAEPRDPWPILPTQAIRAMEPRLVVAASLYIRDFQNEVATGNISRYGLHREYPFLAEDVAAYEDGDDSLWGTKVTQVWERRPDVGAAVPRLPVVDSE